jgi:hypothetical protein
MRTLVGAATMRVEAGKVALTAPRPTVTLDGTETAASSLVSVTVAPPLGAGLGSVTVPVDEEPPTSVHGFIWIVGGLGVTVSAATTTGPTFAATLTVVEAETDCVVTVKEAVVWPAAIKTDLGTEATFPLLVASGIVRPLAGAADASVRIPFDGVPPSTVDGLRTRDAPARVDEGLSERLARAAAEATSVRLRTSEPRRPAARWKLRQGASTA